MSDTKLCKDCLHCRPARHYTSGELGGHEWHTYHDARCALTDLVTGNGSAGQLCTHARSFGGGCGVSGFNFEPLPEVPATQEQKRRWRQR